jgi:hypothetical protein
MVGETPTMEKNSSIAGVTPLMVSNRKHLTIGVSSPTEIKLFLKVHLLFQIGINSIQEFFSI